ncbi:hypothetical protein Efla_002521 [Eimeria flavescens]
MTLGGCLISAAACCGLAVVAPLAAAPHAGGPPVSAAAERCVFNACCILVGALGLCCSAVHSGVYGLHAIIRPSLAAAWALGSALGGPLSVAVALLLFACCGGSNNSPSFSTRLLLGLCAAWLVAAGSLLAAAIRLPATKRLLRLQMQQSMQRGPFSQQVAAFSSRSPTAAAATATGAGAGGEGDAQEEKDEEEVRGVLCAASDASSEGARREGPSLAAEGEETQALLQGPRRSSSYWFASPPLLLSKPAAALGTQWHFYAEAVSTCRCSLLCCFFLSLTTFVLYPVKVQHMKPCNSNSSPAFFQLLLVASHHLGVVLGRCLSTCCCALSFRWIPAVLLLRLSLLPLLFWIESLPAAAGLLPAATAAAAAFHQQQRQQQQEALLLLLDGCRCLALLVFSALHGHLSVVGAVHATRLPDTLPGRQAAAYAMSLSDTLGVAAGTALSVLIPAAPQQLDTLGDTAAATAHNLA